jgi:hypothetical protein
MRSFDLGEKFKFIFIPAQSFSHLLSREDGDGCLSCVRRYLIVEGRLLIELFNSSVKMFACESGRRYSVGQYEDPKAGSQVLVTDKIPCSLTNQSYSVFFSKRRE